ncbi:putative bifunctional diguanylate cyclase/phosphodiesterase [Aquipuribacter hungaricus]|uniref:Bifunctional diguanylate cyclase/phosphodiesterase n=1 Tax=Aquipuribacter hungaricus TaxID=545624 RepID=A0ABV7WKY6_9MICO
MSSRRYAISVFSALLALAAVLLHLGPLRGVTAPLEGPPWWLLVPAFVLAELVVVHVQARRESLSVSFREVPLVVGLVLLAPVELLAASVLGSAVAMLRRRSGSEKLLFNLSLLALEASLAAALYHLALGTADPTSARGLLAALATVVVTDLVGAAALTAVVWLKVRAFDDGVLVEAVTTGLVAALTNTSLGLLVVVLLDTRPVALVLLVGVLLTVALAYRGYSSLDRSHARLESLYRFTRRVQEEVDTAEVCRTVLRQARDILASQGAELLVLPARGGTDPGLLLRLVGDEVVEEPLVVPAWLAEAVDGRAVRRHGQDDAGPRDALAAPLHVDGDVDAVLAVVDRPHHLGPFGSEDLRLLGSLANHTAVQLQKSRLLDRLRAEAERQEQLSLHDQLTGLPNRRHALGALTAELGRGGSTAVLVLDLDGFTDINEAFGHGTGDELLQQVGARLVPWGSAPGHVARLGNDEFVVLFRDVGTVAQAQQAVRPVLAALAGPFRLGGTTVDVRVVAGLAVAPEHGGSADGLLRRADAAMYAAKREGVAVRTWDPLSEGDSVRRLTLLRHLRETIEAGQLQVHYQPKVHPGTGRVVGAEALARWTHPAHGRVTPDEFVLLAERSGLIHPLTDLVLRTALEQCRQWRVSVPGLSVAVNLSARSLLNEALPEQVAAALARAGLPSSALTLELTETAVMVDVDHALVVLRGLADLGVTLSIDDFGTGQSSLAYLKMLPVGEVKVDRSFVAGASGDAGDAAIVGAAVDLAHTHGLVVVAEGVEDDVTRRLLVDRGCDVIQGYLVSRPLAPEAFGAWLAAHPQPVGPAGATGQEGRGGGW